MKIIKPLLLAISACAYAYAFAEGNNALPQENVQGAVSYISGGVGKDESDAIKQAEKRYPLALEFSRHGAGMNEYVADVRLTIEDKAGNIVLRADSLGPFVLARMSDGRYTVKAERGGRTQVRQVSVAAGKSEHVAIGW